MSLRTRISTVVLTGLCLAIGSVTVQAADAYLLDVGKGQKPNDTGSDGETKMTIEKLPDLGSALKVVFASGDSFGDRSARVKNWKPYAYLRFEVLNPSREKVGIELNVNHKRTTAYETRVVREITLDPGRNTVRIPLDELLNVDGSAPDLTSVGKWYIAVGEDQSPTLYFSSFVLQGADSPEPVPPNAVPANTVPANVGPPNGIPAINAIPPGVLPGNGFRVQGKVGDLNVDLIITPLAPQPTVPAAPGASGIPGIPQSARPVSVSGDDARLARIRAAKMPQIRNVVSFDTPEADVILSALEVFPADNPFNLDVSQWPLHPQSSDLVSTIGRDKPFRVNYDMGFSIIPPTQKRVDIANVEYADESDEGPFPIPNNVPIEGWPLSYRGKGVSLEQVQRNTLNEEGDRHAIVLDPTNRMLYEFFNVKRTDGGWDVSQASVFDLKSNKLRPDGWTSADAAGLPIFPAVVRYDELKRGMVEHAMRVTVPRSRRAYVYPATHQAGHGDDENLPRMGERLRLRADFPMEGFSPEATAILKGLKKYGMFVADNGISWAISVAPDARIPDMHAEMRKLKGSDFEVIHAPEGYQPPTE
ncbi:MAG: hypothetical protein IT428_32620 [Planctomycetaceae bacterium]|nr:hypothetical protein [Planctomycetaceae bacterium]